MAWFGDTITCITPFTITCITPSTITCITYPPLRVSPIHHYVYHPIHHYVYHPLHHYVHQALRVSPIHYYVYHPLHFAPVYRTIPDTSFVSGWPRPAFATTVTKHRWMSEGMHVDISCPYTLSLAVLRMASASAVNC